MPQDKTTPTESAESHVGGGLQTVVITFGMCLVSVVVGTALFGPAEKSERAFRLLHWWKRDPEPAPPAQRRAQRAKRD
ncbi:hypothetical protein [Streptomyces sp. IBSBF 2950]|uniref:hypothetical protein n=1 Tax=Streptomyces sp. IBSBF 2950 TaxID=2903528 RepID=UPI002FDBB72A